MRLIALGGLQLRSLLLSSRPAVPGQVPARCATHRHQEGSISSTAQSGVSLLSVY